MMLPAFTLAAMPGLFAHGDGEGNLWLAQVVESGDKNNPLTTIIRYRGKADANWQEAAKLAGRVTGIAPTTGQLAILLEGGEWLMIGTAGLISGPSLPGRHPIRAIGSDGETLWSIAVVTGELPAPRRAIAATTRSTQPATTRAVVETPVEPTGPTEPRVMLFRLGRDGWSPVGQIDVPLDASFNITGARARPLIGARTAVGTMRLFDQTTHQGDITLGQAQRFALLSHESVTLLWTAPETGPGEIERRGLDEDAVPLKVAGGKQVGADRAVAIATGRLRLFFVGPNPRAKDAPPVIFEQKYDLKDFSPIGEPVMQSFPAADLDPRLDSSIRALVLAAMIFAMIASFQHRGRVRELMEQEDRPEPAPLGRRIGGAAIDLLSLVVATGAGYFPFADHPNASLGFQVSLVTGPVGYVLYTMLTELILQRTPGKILMGLKVITLDGETPTKGMIVLRNALRIIDVFASPMLVLMLISPLRQRAGDIAAGTLVISVNQPPRSKEEMLEKEDVGAEK